MNQSNSKILLGFALLFGGGIFCLSGSTNFQFSPAVVVTILALLLLEPGSARHNLYGMAPSTFPLYIYLALLPGSTVGLAMIACMAAVGLRSATSKRERGNWAAWEFLTDTLSICSSLTALKLLADVGPRWNEQPVIAIFAAALLHFMIRPILHNAWTGEIPRQERNSWESDQLRATTLLSVVSFLGLPYGFLAGTETGLAFMLPIAPFLLSLALTPILNSSNRGQGSVPAQSERAPKKSKTSEATMLDFRREEFSFMRNLSESLSHDLTMPRVTEEVVLLARRLTTVSNTVLFLERDGHLYAAESKSPYQEALKKAEQDRVEEPVIRRAFRTRQPDFLREEDSEWERIFTDDKFGVAVSMHTEGVLYIGRDTNEPFTDEDISRLSVLGHQAYMALLAARASDSHKLVLANHQKASIQAESLATGVGSAIKIMTELIPVLEPMELMDKAGARLGQLVAHDYWALFAGRPEQQIPEFFLAGPPGKPKTDDEALQTIAQQVMQRRLPLLEGDLKESALPQPSSGSRSLLACPMYEAEGPIGAIILCSASRDAFSESDRDLLRTLSHQLGSHFWVAILQNQLERTLKSLKTSQSQLVQSSKMAAVGQLGASVAHELNTPLGSLLLALEGAARVVEKRPEKVAERMQKALQSAEQLKEIVDKLLFYSQEGEVDHQETDLNRVIEDTLGLIGRQLNLDDIDFQLDLGEIDIVMANPNEMQQVVINLLTNAKVAVLARKGEFERRIVVTTSNHARAIELAVEDNGVGMTEDTVKSLFEPFYSEDGAGLGTGLGLVVTKEIVEKHGGAIRVKSEVNEGTKFMLRLPKVNTT